MVVAPSLIPKRAGDRVKTDRRDAIMLARLLRAGELTAVWVPDAGHEAMRDLVRARAAAVETQRVHRQQVSAFMLKHGRIFPRKTTWGARHFRWLQEQHFDHPAHQIALQELVDAVRVAKERIGRIEAAIEEFLPGWSLAPVVRALQALRGVELIVAVTFVTEIGDMRRFDNPRQLMGHLGLVPGERSSGDTVRRGGITKAGNGRVRHMLVESAWTNRHPPRVGKAKVTLEIPAALHRDLAAYAEILAREINTQPAEPVRLIVPMLERFIATDRGFATLPCEPVAKPTRPACVRTYRRMFERLLERLAPSGWRAGRWSSCSALRTSEPARPSLPPCWNRCWRRRRACRTWRPCAGGSRPKRRKYRPFGDRTRAAPRLR